MIVHYYVHPSGHIQIIPLVGFALNGANVVGYVKCRRDAGAKISKMATQFIGKQILDQVCVNCNVCILMVISELDK